MSLILLTSDWHLTDKQPTRRKDNYWKTQKQKLQWIVDFSNEHRVDCALNAGDVFDSVRTSNRVLQETIEILKGLKCPLYAVAGQHDKYYHSSDLVNSPLSVLEKAGVLRLNPRTFDMSSITDFVNHEENIPDTRVQNKFLVIHRMVVDEKLWEGQKDYDYGVKLLRQNDYDLILSGDNHKQFYVQSKGKTLVNPGSLMRMTIAQLDHEPAVFLYNVDTKELYRYPIPTEPIETVFNTEDIESEKMRSEDMEKFAAGLASSDVMSEMNFVKNLKAFIKQNGIDKATQDIINEVIDNER